MDSRSTYTVSVYPQDPDYHGPDTRSFTLQALSEFILNFHIDNVFLYRDQLRTNVLVKHYYCEIDIAHLISYNEELASRLNNEPAAIIPIVRSPPKETGIQLSAT